LIFVREEEISLAVATAGLCKKDEKRAHHNVRKGWFGRRRRGKGNR